MVPEPAGHFAQVWGSKNVPVVPVDDSRNELVLCVVVTVGLQGSGGDLLDALDREA